MKEMYEPLNEGLVWAAIQQVINEGVSRVGEINRWGGEGGIEQQGIQVQDK